MKREFIVSFVNFGFVLSWFLILGVEAPCRRVICERVICEGGRLTHFPLTKRIRWGLFPPRAPELVLFDQDDERTLNNWVPDTAFGMYETNPFGFCAKTLYYVFLHGKSDCGKYCGERYKCEHNDEEKERVRKMEEERAEQLELENEWQAIVFKNLGNRRKLRNLRADPPCTPTARPPSPPPSPPPRPSRRGSLFQALLDTPPNDQQASSFG